MFTPVAFWQLSQQAVTPGLTALDYGRAVALRNNGLNTRAQWSNDGITWNLATTPNSYPQAGIDFSPQLGLYVACASGALFDNIMTSTNGVVWTSVSKPDNQSLRYVTWCSTWNKFLIYGANNLFESSDGVNWSLGFYHGLSASGFGAGASIRRGLFTTFSSANHTGGTSSTGKSIFLGPTPYASSAPLQTMVIYSEDGLNFKTYSVFQASGLLASIVFTRTNWVDYYVGRQNTGTRILSTQSMNATQSTSWAQVATTAGNVANNAYSSLGPEDYRGCVVYCNDSTSVTTTPIRYTLTVSSTGVITQTVIFPSAIYAFRDIIYARALSRWIVVSSANITAGAIWTGGAGAGGTVSSTNPPSTWTSRTAAGSIIECITFGEGVRTTGYRKGASIS
jgi:hypothetical protein